MPILALLLALSVPPLEAGSIFDGPEPRTVPIQFAPPGSQFGRMPADLFDEEENPPDRIDDYIAGIKKAGCGVVLLHFTDATLVIRRATGDPNNPATYRHSTIRALDGEEMNRLRDAAKDHPAAVNVQDSYFSGANRYSGRWLADQVRTAAARCVN